MKRFWFAMSLPLIVSCDSPGAPAPTASPSHQDTPATIATAAPVEATPLPAPPTTFTITNNTADRVFIRPGLPRSIFHDGQLAATNSPDTICRCGDNGACTAKGFRASRAIELAAGLSHAFAWEEPVLWRKDPAQKDCDFTIPAAGDGWSAEICWSKGVVQSDPDLLLDSPTCRTVPFELGTQLHFSIDPDPQETP